MPSHTETRVSTLITPLLKGAPQTVQNTLSPRSCDQKMNTDHQNNTGDDTSRFLYSQHTVINIDQMQANKDPNYNADYAWSIARMKQDEEVCFWRSYSPMFWSVCWLLSSLFIFLTLLMYCYLGTLCATIPCGYFEEPRSQSANFR